MSKKGRKPPAVGQRGQQSNETQKRAANVVCRADDVVPATNWSHGEWLMTMSLEELDSMKGADVLYRKVMNKQGDY